MYIYIYIYVYILCMYVKYMYICIAQKMKGQSPSCHSGSATNCWFLMGPMQIGTDLNSIERQNKYVLYIICAYVHIYIYI